MYQTIDNTLCITVNDWCAAGLTKNQFENDSKRGALKIFKRSQNGNTLIDVRSITRPDRLEVIQNHHGHVEALEATTQTTIPIDEEAAAFFRRHRYGNNMPLPEEIIEEYTNHASILNYLIRLKRNIIQARARGPKKLYREEWFQICFTHAKDAHYSGLGNTLHNKTSRVFERIYKEYMKQGYPSLIHGNYGGASALKLCDEAKEWLVSRYATPIDRVTLRQLHAEYNCIVPEKGWKQVKSPSTINLFLNRPEIKPLWHGARYGELKSKEKYTRQHRTILPTMRDALWYGDGTKLNYFYLNDKGDISTINVYEVMDVSSECLLGYHISESENFEAQYRAYKSAMQFSGSKPYEIKFDNQGGHKKLVSVEFFKKLSRLAIRTQPYNGRSKTIESAFGRFQAEFLHKDWFFTGQNIQAKKIESKANVEFILANKTNLPTLEEIVKIYEKRRNEWNSAPHYDTGISRIEMYRNSTNPKAQKVEIFDMIYMFGIRNEEPCTYHSNGIQIKIKKQKYAFEVLDHDGNPDFGFMRNNIDRKFIVEYDPEDMSHVSLYEKTPSGDLRFTAIANKYINIHRDTQSQDGFDSHFIKYVDRKNKELREDMQHVTESLLEKYGMHPAQHGLNMPKPKGLGKRAKEDIGVVLKKESNLLPVGNEYDDVYDKY